MLEPDLMWHWLRANDPLSALSHALPFLAGATLASLVTWIEGHLELGENLDSRTADLRPLQVESPSRGA